MLELSAITAGYGEFTALWDVSLRVDAGEAVAVVGPNGAGKTTLMRVISGLVTPRAGRLVFDGQVLTGRPPHAIVGHGIAHVPEGRRIFPGLTVEDNLKMGAFPPAARQRYRESLEQVFALFPVLAERRRQRAGTMSGGEQQMLAIGRALMTRPALLCMDEPSMGLAPRLVEEVFDIIRAINEQGTTIFVIEQNVNMALTIAHRGYVLQMGEVVLTGTAQELLESPLIQKAYLGGG